MSDETRSSFFVGGYKLSEDKIYRVGLVGMGHIAGAHRSAYGAIKGTEVVAAADISEDARKAFAKERGLKNVYADYREMLDKENLDIVSVCTWAQTHAEVTIEAAARKPQAIMCEKPMATGLKEADNMLEACRENGVKLAIGHHSRFCEDFREVKRRLDAGEIGKLLWMRGACPLPLHGQGTHVVDLMNMFVDDVGVTSVLGQIDYSGKGTLQGIPSEDCAFAGIQYKNGVRGYLECAQVFEDSGENYVLLYGEAGELRAEFSTTKPHLRIRNRQYRDWTRFDADAPYFACFTGEMQELVEAINEDREHLCNGERGRAALEILNAVFISSEKRGRVHFPYEPSEEYPLARMIREGLI